MLAVAIYAAQAEADQISGKATAIDSTIIQIGDQRVMLFGVDSVLRKQICWLDGKPWQCWTAAVNELQSLLDQGTVTCDVVGDPDAYGRVLGRCLVNGQSVNEQLIDRGFAVARPADTTDYAAAEASAKSKKVGLWRGQFQNPNDFRRAAGIMVQRP